MGILVRLETALCCVTNRRGDMLLRVVVWQHTVLMKDDGLPITAEKPQAVLLCGRLTFTFLPRGACGPHIAIREACTRSALPKLGLSASPSHCPPSSRREARDHEHTEYAEAHLSLSLLYSQMEITIKKRPTELFAHHPEPENKVTPLKQADSSLQQFRGNRHSPYSATETYTCKSHGDYTLQRQGKNPAQQLDVSLTPLLLLLEIKALAASLRWRSWFPTYPKLALNKRNYSGGGKGLLTGCSALQLELTQFLPGQLCHNSAAKAGPLLPDSAPAASASADSTLAKQQRRLEAPSGQHPPSISAAVLSVRQHPESILIGNCEDVFGKEIYDNEYIGRRCKHKLSD
ncbi:hypothetical protein Anapl_15251 [Anas platyrhynchos]|uniref:Uncharacterized protein n=1 Tax=Anas platyrhynchos TaxID=8839 RepID=R0JWY4_ANAPL|nr:hypothetical protein Anapl_15251 [Anas platyrhynchos]